MTEPKEEVCGTCEGEGEVWWDAVDARGEHTTIHKPCPECAPCSECAKYGLDHDQGHD